MAIECIVEVIWLEDLAMDAITLSTSASRCLLRCVIHVILELVKRLPEEAMAHHQRHIGRSHRVVNRAVKCLHLLDAIVLLCAFLFVEGVQVLLVTHVH